MFSPLFGKYQYLPFQCTSAALHQSLFLTYACIKQVLTGKIQYKKPAVHKCGQPVAILEWRSYLAFSPAQSQQEQEQVDEIQIEAQCAQNTEACFKFIIALL